MFTVNSQNGFSETHHSEKFVSYKNIIVLRFSAGSNISTFFFFLGIKFYKIDPRVLSNFLTVAFLGEMAKLATARTLRMEKSFWGPFYSALI